MFELLSLKHGRRFPSPGLWHGVIIKLVLFVRETFGSHNYNVTESAFFQRRLVVLGLKMVQILIFDHVDHKSTFYYFILSLKKSSGGLSLLSKVSRKGHIHFVCEIQHYRVSQKNVPNFIFIV